MKQLTIISGKGGTGKTTITAAFATLSDSHVVADCDVDAADLHLILNPSIEKSEEFYGGKTAVIDSDKCQQCDECIRVCRFDAIKDYTVDPHLVRGLWGLCAGMSRGGYCDGKAYVRSLVYLSYEIRIYDARQTGYC